MLRLPFKVDGGAPVSQKYDESIKNWKASPTIYLKYKVNCR